MAEINQVNGLYSMIQKGLGSFFDRMISANIQTGICTEYDLIHSWNKKEKTYNAVIYELAQDMETGDREKFIFSTRLSVLEDRLSDSGTGAVDYKTGAGQETRYYRLTVCFGAEDKKTLLLLIQDMTKEKRELLQLTAQYRRDRDYLYFLAEHLCENFMETDVKSGKSRLLHMRGRMEERPSFREQIQWFADNLIAEEEREQYRKEYELTTLVSSLHAQGGVISSSYTALYDDGPHYMTIVCALVEGQEGEEERIISFVQDVTKLREQEQQNRRLIHISNQLLDVSRLDSLTGLYNRSTGEQFIEEYLNSQDAVLGTMFLLDIDHFKDINDNFGHTAGDHALKYMGILLKQVFRSGDMICRWGGDEFLVFMRNTSQYGMIESRISQLREQAAGYVMEKGPLPMMLSIGVAAAKKGDTVHSLFEKVDHLLYEVKKHGRNGHRVEI